MLATKIRGICLTYGNLVKKILEFTGFNFKGEYFEEDVTKIGEVALIVIRQEIINEKSIQTPSKGKKRGTEEKNQEAPKNLEDLEYSIPETPFVKDLLNEIIKNLKRTNEKINFLDFHLAQDLKNLPHGMFTDDDEDDK